MAMISVTEASKKWGISTRRIQVLCKEGRIQGAQLVGTCWTIPDNAPKPVDQRSTRYSKTERLPNQQFTSIDLFSGPGGLATGFKWAGIKALIAVEWSYWTVQTYAKSHDAEIFNLDDYLTGKMEDPSHYFQPSDRTLLIYGDINKVEGSLIKKILKERFGRTSVDIVTGGAPCESFSMAGDRKEDDDRNFLYQNVLRIARAVKSKMFLFENVKGLFSKKLDGKPGKMFEHILEEFETPDKKGTAYKLASKDKKVVLLKATDYGVPQARERLILIGLNTKYPKLKFNYPKKTHGPGCQYPYVTVEEAIMDLPQIGMGEESNVYSFDLNTVTAPEQASFLRRMRGDLSMAPASFTPTSLFNHKAPGHTKKMYQRICLIKQGEGMQDAYDRLEKEGRDDLVKQCFPKKIYMSRNRRLVPSQPSCTITSHCLDELIHPYLNRGMTPREVARLQSFPDWYQFQGPYVKFHSDPQQDQYEQIGDAIPPLLGLAIGAEVVETLKNAAK
jgi:DNA (cytosine-5)-methyltransferase 1